MFTIDMLSAATALVIAALGYVGTLVWFLSRTKEELRSTRSEVETVRKLAQKTMKHLNRVRRELAQTNHHNTQKRQEA